MVVPRFVQTFILGMRITPTSCSRVPLVAGSGSFIPDPAVGESTGFDYTRSSNPTRQTLEAQLSAIEGLAHCRTYASGLSAVDAISDLEALA